MAWFGLVGRTARETGAVYIAVDLFCFLFCICRQSGFLLVALVYNLCFGWCSWTTLWWLGWVWIALRVCTGLWTQKRKIQRYRAWFELYPIYLATVAVILCRISNIEDLAFFTLFPKIFHSLWILIIVFIVRVRHH
jgi:hypothetical protein